MEHVAIMKKQWGLIPKILSCEKTVESRWYKSKIPPWNKIKIGETIYFKDSGSPVTVKATVTKVLQYNVESNSQAFEIMQKHAFCDLGTNVIPKDVRNYIADKKYAVFVFFDKVEKVEPFQIDKTGFGMQCAWITTESISRLKV